MIHRSLTLVAPIVHLGSSSGQRQWCHRRLWVTQMFSVLLSFPASVSFPFVPLWGCALCRRQKHSLPREAHTTSEYKFVHERKSKPHSQQLDRFSESGGRKLWHRICIHESASVSTANSFSYYCNIQLKQAAKHRRTPPLKNTFVSCCMSPSFCFSKTDTLESWQALTCLLRSNSVIAPAWIGKGGNGEDLNLPSGFLCEDVGVVAVTHSDRLVAEHFLQIILLSRGQMRCPDRSGTGARGTGGTVSLPGIRVTVASRANWAPGLFR